MVISKGSMGPFVSAVGLLLFILPTSTGAQAVIDNLAFGLDAFQAEGVVDKPLLFVCVEAGAEQIALHLIKKGADVRECVTVRDKHAAQHNIL